MSLLLLNLRQSIRRFIDPRFKGSVCVGKSLNKSRTRLPLRTSVSINCNLTPNPFAPILSPLRAFTLQLYGAVPFPLAMKQSVANGNVWDAKLEFSFKISGKWLNANQGNSN